jgi:hypothetical protein
MANLSWVFNQGILHPQNIAGYLAQRFGKDRLGQVLCDFPAGIEIAGVTGCADYDRQLPIGKSSLKRMDQVPPLPGLHLWLDDHCPDISAFKGFQDTIGFDERENCEILAELSLV